MKSLKQGLHFHLLAIAVICVVLTSCTQKEKKLIPEGTRAQNVGILASCLTGTASISVTGTGFNYNNWPVTNWTFPSGGPTIRFEGQYASFIRPSTTDTFFVGTFSLADTCQSWATIAPTIQVKNASGNLGTSPTTTDNPAGIYNVVGADGTVTAGGVSAFFNLGYYVYSNTLHSYVINDAVAVWGINGQTTKSVATNPANSRKAYIIRVLSITPGGTVTAPTSVVTFRWIRII